MAGIVKIIDSFNAGLLSAEMDSRLQVEKVQAGCRQLLNFIPRVHGPVFRRPGLEDLGALESDDAGSRLFSFNYSVSTRFVLELFAGGMNVWSNGYLVPINDPIVMPYAQEHLFEVQMRQINDVCYLVHDLYNPIKLIRKTDLDWEVSDVFDLLDGIPDGEVVVGASGTALVEWWTPWKSGFPTTQAAVTALKNNAGFSTAPNGTGTTTSLAIPALPAAGGNFMRRIRGKIHFPSTGQWRFYFKSDQGAVLYISGAYVGSIFYAGNPAYPLGELSFVPATTYTVGIDYQFELYTWNTAGAFETTISWQRVTPVGTKAVVPTSAIKMPDVAPASTDYRATINQWPPMLDENVTEITMTPGATTGTDITLIASGGCFQPGHVGAFYQLAHKREDSFIEILGTGVAPPATSPFGPTTSSWLRVLGGWNFYSYGIWAGTVYLERKNQAGGADVIRSWDGNHDRNISADGNEEQETELRLRISAMTGQSGSSADAPRFLLECADSLIYGLVKITIVTDCLNARCSVVKDLWSTDPTLYWTEGAFSTYRGFPRAVGLYQQRLLFAGTKSSPLRLWGSVTGDIENFRRGTIDDSSFDFTLAAEESNAIQWLISFSRLLIGTSGEVWSATGATDGGVITPTSVKFTQGGRFGSAYLPAQLVNEVPAFVERTGRKVRKVTYSTEEEKYIGANLTVLVESITEGKIIQTAFSAQPSAILWAVTGDGRLIGMTFEQEQNVFAWHEHVTDGLFESVASIYGEDADEVWVCVLRNETRRMQRLDTVAMSLDWSAPHRLMYLDSARRYEFDEPDTTLTGLEHLAGQEVSIVADGAEISSTTVSEDGEIELDTAATTVIVGVPYESILQPMKQEFQMQNGSAQGRPVILREVVVKLYNSMGGQVADAPDGRFQTWPYRAPVDLMDTALPLFTGEKQVHMESETRSSVDVTLKSSAPFPLNVTGLVIKIDVFDK